jgi:hypothetical protein
MSKLKYYQNTGPGGTPPAQPFSDPLSYHGGTPREVPYVVVIGAGVTGLTAAHELVERGFAVQVVEPAVDPDGGVDTGGLAATQYAKPLQPQPCTLQARSPLFSRTFPILPPPLELSVAGPGSGAAMAEAADLIWRGRRFALTGAGQVRVRHVAAGALLAAVERHALEEGSAGGAPLPTTVTLQINPRLAVEGRRHGRSAHHQAAGEAVLDGFSDLYKQLAMLPNPTDHGVVVHLKTSADARPRIIRIAPGEARTATRSQSTAGRLLATDRATRFSERLSERVSGGERQAAPAARPDALLLIQIVLPEPLPCCPQGEDPTVLVSFVRSDWVPGEHGYRFFPRFYRHVFDTMKRTPTYDAEGRVTYRTTWDNLVPTVSQGVGYPEATSSTGTTIDKRTVVVRRDRPASFEDFRELQRDMYLETGLGFTDTDMARYQLEVFRYMTACAERRESWARDPKTGTWWDFMQADGVVHKPDGSTEPRYSAAFKTHLKATSLALVAMDEKEIDTRTYGNISMQLLLDQVTSGDDTDMTLNGPTSEAWFHHWKRYLVDLGVRFFEGRLTGLSTTTTRPELPTAPAPSGQGLWPVWGPSWGQHGVLESDTDRPNTPDTEGGLVAGFGAHTISTAYVPEPDAGTPHGFNTYDACEGGKDKKEPRHFDPDYYVIAMPLDRLWRVLDTVTFKDLDDDQANPTTDLGRLKKWKTRVLTQEYPFEGGVGPEREGIRYEHDEPWYEDQGRRGPFRHFSGLQFYFDADFKYNDGHVYFPEAAWGLSSISQAQFWHAVRIWQRGFHGLLSVDIGDMTTKVATGGAPAQAAAWDETQQGIAELTWMQIEQATPTVINNQLPPPRYFHMDAHLLFVRDAQPTATPPLDAGQIVRNSAPFLINRPIKNGWMEWDCRPGRVYLYTEDPATHPLPGRDHVDMHEHFGRWVVAGNHTRTFTRMSTMESANESARHAVNSIIEHLATRHPTNDQRAVNPSYDGHRSAGVLMGDPAPIWDMERHELPDLAFWRRVDERLVAAGLPEMADILELHEHLEGWFVQMDELERIIKQSEDLVGAAAGQAGTDWAGLPGGAPPGANAALVAALAVLKNL